MSEGSGGSPKSSQRSPPREKAASPKQQKRRNTSAAAAAAAAARKKGPRDVAAHWADVSTDVLQVIDGSFAMCDAFPDRGPIELGWRLAKKFGTKKVANAQPELDRIFGAPGVRRATGQEVTEHLQNQLASLMQVALLVQRANALQSAAADLEVQHSVAATDAARAKADARSSKGSPALKEAARRMTQRQVQVAAEMTAKRAEESEVLEKIQTELESCGWQAVRGRMAAGRITVLEAEITQLRSQLEHAESRAEAQASLSEWATHRQLGDGTEISFITRGKCYSLQVSTADSPLKISCEGANGHDLSQDVLRAKGMEEIPPQTSLQSDVVLHGDDDDVSDRFVFTLGDRRVETWGVAIQDGGELEIQRLDQEPEPEPESVMISVPESHVIRLTSELAGAEQAAHDVQRVVDSLKAENDSLKQDCKSATSALTALMHEKEAVESRCAAVSVELQNKKEEEAMLMQLVESKETVVSNAKQLHDKAASDLTEAKLLHRSEVDLLRTELVDALEAQESIVQEKVRQAQEVSDAASAKAIEDVSAYKQLLSESNALVLHAEARAEKAELEAALLRDEVARLAAELGSNQSKAATPQPEAESRAEYLEKLKAVFDEFDIDHDGTVDAAELKTVMQRFGMNPTAEDLQRMLGNSDAASTGTISFEAFVSLVEHETQRGEGDGSDGQFTIAQIIDRVRAYKEALDRRDFDALERMTAGERLS